MGCSIQHEDLALLEYPWTEACPFFRRCREALLER